MEGVVSPDWAAKAQANSRRRGGRPCAICSAPEVAQGIRAMCTERAEGRATISYAGMCEVVFEELEVKLSPNTLRNHIAEHLPELHKQIRDRDRQV